MTDHEAGVRLSEEERAILLTPCACGHTLNDHGDMGGCWVCNDEGDRECWVRCEDMFAECAAQIVDSRLAALTAERDELRATVDRVRALADEWEATVYKLPPGYPMTVNEFCRHWFKAPLRAALGEDQP